MSELFIYIRDSPAKHFPRLLYQTRYGEICFVCFLQLVNVLTQRSTPLLAKIQQRGFVLMGLERVSRR